MIKGFFTVLVELIIGIIWTLVMVAVVVFGLLLAYGALHWLVTN